MAAKREGAPVRAIAKRFVWLWLPGLAVFFLGLSKALLTGQVDPWQWAMPTCLTLVFAGFVVGRIGAPLLLWAGMGWTGTVLLFCGLAAGRAPNLIATGGILLLALTAGAGAMLLRGGMKARLAGGAVLFLAAMLLWRGPPQPIQSVPERPKLAVVTALPLFWSEDGSGRRADAPIMIILRTRFTLVPLDDPAALSASGARLLLIAQPRSIPPDGLVVIDRWVRNGGRALILADPLLRWPSVLPPGDRRRAPISASSLYPLGQHWKMETIAIAEGESRRFLPDGTLLTLSDAALFRDGVVASRRIGRGAVTWVGDADMLDDPLWLADPTRPLDPTAWSADTPALVTQWLGKPLPGDRRWMRSERHVAAALRWALLAGTIWAILGGMVLSGIFGGNRGFATSLGRGG